MEEKPKISKYYNKLRVYWDKSEWVLEEKSPLADDVWNELGTTKTLIGMKRKVTAHCRNKVANYEKKFGVNAMLVTTIEWNNVSAKDFK